MPMKKSLPARPGAAEASLSDRIIGAAFAAFMENGYGPTTMLEIATRAKLSKRDLYANFDNKQAVLLACIANRAVRMRLAPDLPAPRDRETLAATMISFGRTVVREVSDPAVTAIYRLAVAEAVRAPEAAETLNAIRFINRGALADLVARAQANGILGPGDPPQMVEQFFALLWGDLMLNRLLGGAAAPKPAEIDRRAREATDAFLKLYAPAAAEQR
jgi:AcrR family transcriptional regulator